MADIYTEFSTLCSYVDWQLAHRDHPCITGKCEHKQEGVVATRECAATLMLNFLEDSLFNRDPFRRTSFYRFSGSTDEPPQSQQAEP